MRALQGLLTAPRRTRTFDPLIKSQLPENHKGGCSKDLPNKQARRAAPATARSAEKSPGATDSDPALARLIDAWPSLPEPVKAGIVAMVKHDGGARENT